MFHLSVAIVIKLASLVLLRCPKLKLYASDSVILKMMVAKCIETLKEYVMQLNYES
jgi:hypothetical protein